MLYHRFHVIEGSHFQRSRFGPLTIISGSLVVLVASYSSCANKGSVLFPFVQKLPLKETIHPNPIIQPLSLHSEAAGDNQ